MAGIDSQKMPALFIGHGSPMNGVEENVYTHAWARLGEELPKPKAILCVSAHWLTQGTYAHTNEAPKLIYDFYGFPEELYELTYPVAGAPDVARTVEDTVTEPPILPDEEWGIDHGAWIVLLRMYPKADVPVFQLSIDISQPATFHYELGKRLAFLREQGVLVMGSGNIVHNLSKVDFSPHADPFSWATEFDGVVRDHIEKDDHEPLIHYETLGEAAVLSIPTPDHYLPLLYVLGMKQKDDPVSFPVEGIALGSISMRAVRIG